MMQKLLSKRAVLEESVEEEPIQESAAPNPFRRNFDYGVSMYPHRTQLTPR